MGEHQHHMQSVLNPHIFGMWCNFALSAALITYVVVRMANTLREQQRELTLHREQAMHNEQLLAVATLAAGTAHELGTPLGTMMIVLDDMQTADTDVRADIDLLKQQVQSCRATLKKLVSTAETHRTQRPISQPIDTFLHELLERWQVVRPSAQFNLHVHSGSAPNIHGDEALRQAIINLLDNGADTDSGPLQLHLDWTNTHIELRIRDRGPGIGFDIAEQLGKPFITSKGKGLGLGLFLSHATIERGGGDIRLYNHARGRNRSHPAAADRGRRRMSECNFLVVDDDASFCHVLTRALTRRGIAACSANNMAEALEQAQNNPLTRALIDLKLADESGLDVISALKQARPELDIIMLTGYSSIATAVEAVKRGALNYLCKPAGIDEI